MKTTMLCSVFLVLLRLASSALSETAPIQHIPASVDFSEKLLAWDGFGFNYVEAAQTRDYGAAPQDYGGFSLLKEEQKRGIVEHVFGADGLDIDVLKMFLDPWHQVEPGGPFDHATTTRNMMHFVESGVRLARARGKEIDVITTLYGPPPWATRQKFIGGRDLDEERSRELANYMIDWALFLRNRGINVRYLSIHNEGEDFYRWDFREGTQRLERFDYNAYWPAEQVNRFVIVLSKEIDARGIEDLGVTNGEPSNWTRFYNWGYASALGGDEEVLEHLDLLTTHGFINGDFGKPSYGIANSLTTDLLRSRKPGLHAWVTSMSWGDTNTSFVRMIAENIYTAKVNAVIPWAGIQHPASWMGGDPNPGAGILVRDDGSYEVTTGYYLYKQLTRAGHRGMAVVQATMANPVANLMAFSSNGTRHRDAFVVTSNIRIWKLPFEIKIEGTDATAFRAFRTTQDGKEKYRDLGMYELKDGSIVYDPPFGSVATFFAVK